TTCLCDCVAMPPKKAKADPGEAERKKAALEATRRAIQELVAKGKGKGRPEAQGPAKEAPERAPDASPSKVPKAKAAAKDNPKGRAKDASPAKSPRAKAPDASPAPKAALDGSPSKAGPRAKDASPAKAKAKADASPKALHQARAEDEDEEVKKPSKRRRMPPKAPDSHASSEVLALLSRLASLDEMQRSAFAAGYDAVSMPLNKVTKDMVREAFTWLKAIERELAKPEQCADSLEALSESFYQVVPLLQSEGKEPIVTPELFNKRLRVVSLLSDTEAAHAQMRLLLQFAQEAAASGEGSLNAGQLQLLYKSLKCEIRAEPDGSDAMRMVQQYLGERHGAPLKLKGLFSLSRPQAPSNLAGKRLLWHGVPRTAWLGLLAKGLRLPPREAPSCDAFGKGLYFFDSAGAALDFASGSDFLLLAEVALGASRQLDHPDSRAERLPQGVQSVMGAGVWCPDPAGERRLPDGLAVPLGTLRQVKSTGDLMHNHYVVYNAGQAQLKYLVEVESAADIPA
ncbi:unnamed protein product, partial [Effrenium voratum]